MAGLAAVTLAAIAGCSSANARDSAITTTPAEVITTIAGIADRTAGTANAPSPEPDGTGPSASAEGTIVATTPETGTTESTSSQQVIRDPTDPTTTESATIDTAPVDTEPVDTETTNAEPVETDTATATTETTATTTETVTAATGSPGGSDLGPIDEFLIGDAPRRPGPEEVADASGGLPALAAAFDSLVDRNPAVSVTVWRDHEPVFAKATGIGAGGQMVTPDTPMVLASVSKLITSLTVARLAEIGAIEVDAPVPWDLMGVVRHPAWDDVTVRELLEHSAGMPKAQSSWLKDPGSCSIPLTTAMENPPTMSRTTWLYSNGNYCALGMLIEAVTGVDRATAARVFVFDPIGVTGPHVTTDGLLPSDGPSTKGVARLERLGGAGTWIASSDDVAAMLDWTTPADLRTMAHPAIMIDQYGWGHTGTVDGVKACAWVMEQGRTIVVGIVAGDRPSTGGRVCDVLVPAVATDLGIWADKPHRLPD